MKITAPATLIPGLDVRKNKTGFVAVRLHYSADPEGWPPDAVEAKRNELPGWMFRKEFDIEFGAQSGQPVFEQEWTDAQLQHIRNPLFRMDIEDNGLVNTPAGRLRVYGDTGVHLLNDDDGRQRRFAIGVDVSEGVASSESALVVLDCDNTDGPRQAAEMGDPSITPADLGRFVAATAKHFNDALVCCVRKMHGVTALRAMIDAGCSHLWHHRIADRLVEQQAEALGWAKGEATESLMGPLIDAMHHERIRLRSDELLRQLGEYIYDVSGRITHQRLADLNEQLRQRHGDRAIALALAVKAAKDVGRFIPYGSKPDPRHKREAEYIGQSGDALLRRLNARAAKARG